MDRHGRCWSGASGIPDFWGRLVAANALLGRLAGPTLQLWPAWARTRASERIDEICASVLDATALRRGVLDAMRRVVEFDAFVWLLTDPVTTVGVAPFAQVPCLPELPS